MEGGTMWVLSTATARQEKEVRRDPAWTATEHELESKGANYGHRTANIRHFMGTYPN